MNNIPSRINSVLATLPDHCTLVAVSKTKPSSAIMEAYRAGHRHFGENKVQELTNKFKELPDDICWHMIGHLQRNKVKYIAPFVHLIHGVDSFNLLKEINKQAEKVGRTLNCLLQIHIAQEDTKFGFDEVDLMEVITSNDLLNLKHVKIKGLMGMATFTEDTDQVRKEFKGLKILFDKLKNLDHPILDVTHLSMGMSGDYQIAIQEGSNMIRLGNSIFGERNN